MLRCRKTHRRMTPSGLHCACLHWPPRIPPSFARVRPLRIGHKPVEALGAAGPVGARQLQRRADGHVAQLQPDAGIGFRAERRKRPVRGEQPRRQRIPISRLTARRRFPRRGLTHAPTVPNPLTRAYTEGRITV
jgi:hypothetical protein